MNGGVALCVEVDPHRIERRLETRYLDEQRRRPRRRDRPLPSAREASGAPLSVGLVAQRRRGRAASCSSCGFEADIVTDQTSAHDPLTATCPTDLTLEEAAELRARPTPTSTSAAPRASMAAHCAAMVGFMDAGRRGLRLRQQPARRGPARRLRARLRLPRLRPRLHPPAVLRGQGPVPLGGAVRATRPTSPPPTGPCSRSSPTTRRSPAGSAWPASGSPSRACRRGSAGSATASATGSACASTRWCARGEVQRADRDRPRPPRLRLGRLALPRDRGDGRRLRRDRRLAAARTRSSTPPSGAIVGEHPPRRRRRASGARSTPAWSASPTAPTSPPRSSSAC